MEPAKSAMKTRRQLKEAEKANKKKQKIESA